MPRAGNIAKTMTLNGKQLTVIREMLIASQSHSRFHGRGRHLVGRAKNSDGLGRVIVSVQNGGERIQVRGLFALNRYVPARFPLFARSQ